MRKKLKRIFTWALPICLVMTLVNVPMRVKATEGGGEPQPTEQTNPERTYTVDFGSGKWTIGGVEVTADKTGSQTLTEAAAITLTNFNADTMKAIIRADSGFMANLTVTGSQTSISTRDNTGGVPDE